jgi:aryl-alcohol dehydrogenase-like predicted oxidoreductase
MHRGFARAVATPSTVSGLQQEEDGMGRPLGGDGPEVFDLGLGCMGMSGVYGPADEDESIATINAAIGRGVNLIDTGDFYGMGHNELLVGRASGAG